MTSETVLWAVKVGDEDWQEQVITSSTDPDDPKFAKAEAWAKGNGFDRIRKSTIDLTKPVDFAASLRRPGKPKG